MTIHFVYSFPPDNSKIMQTYKRSKLLLQKLDFDVSYVGRRDGIDTSHWPGRAPISITSNVYNALTSLSHTMLYDWRERLTIAGNERDILIGHYNPDDEFAVWNSSCKDDRFGLRIALVPLSHHMAEFCARMEAYVPYVDSIFGIMGSYWYDTWQDSALSHWKEKIIPIDMAIDINKFPLVKRKFNPPGKRKFFYIGWDGAQKGTHLLSILFGLSKNHKCVSIGSGKNILNIECRPYAYFSKEYVRNLANEFDFFITMGVSDANPTTILEAMGWGFPVCCTPQSGYYNMKEINQMSITDMQHNVEILNYLQYAPEEELATQAYCARKLVEEKYTWERFNNSIVNNIIRISRNKFI
mgnify:CR=1 FL=1